MRTECGGGSTPKARHLGCPAASDVYERTETGSKMTEREVLTTEKLRDWLKGWCDGDREGLPPIETWEKSEDTLEVITNYAGNYTVLGRFEEAKSVLRETLPVARRVLGESHALTVEMRMSYAEALYKDTSATPDDIHEAVKMLEDVAPAARVSSGIYRGPLTESFERQLRSARAALRAREEADAKSSREDRVVETQPPAPAETLAEMLLRKENARLRAAAERVPPVEAAPSVPSERLVPAWIEATLRDARRALSSRETQSAPEAAPASAPPRGAASPAPAGTLAEMLRRAENTRLRAEAERAGAAPLPALVPIKAARAHEETKETKGRRRVALGPPKITGATSLPRLKVGQRVELRPRAGPNKVRFFTISGLEVSGPDLDKVTGKRGWLVGVDEESGDWVVQLGQRRGKPIMAPEQDFVALSWATDKAPAAKRHCKELGSMTYELMHSVVNLRRDAEECNVFCRCIVLFISIVFHIVSCPFAVCIDLFRLFCYFLCCECCDCLPERITGGTLREMNLWIKDGYINPKHHDPALLKKSDLKVIKAYHSISKSKRLCTNCGFNCATNADDSEDQEALCQAVAAKVAEMVPGHSIDSRARTRAEYASNKERYEMERAKENWDIRPTNVSSSGSGSGSGGGVEPGWQCSGSGGDWTYSMANFPG